MPDADSVNSKTSKKRPSRLGRGLSSLMNTPVAVDVPRGTPPEVMQVQGTSEPVTSQDTAAVNRSNQETNGPVTSHQSESDAQMDISVGGGAGDGGGLVMIGVERIQANRHQPRQHFDESALASLSESIKREGLMQPIVLRAMRGAGGAEGGMDKADGQYELVAGERRWRAAQLAGLTQVPALVRELDDQQLAEWALIENLQREDLNPMERAHAFERLATTFNLTHEQVAERVGLNRSTVSNLLRLLNLNEYCQQLVNDQLLSMGQARALAGLTAAEHSEVQKTIADQAVKQGLSVRQVEAMVREAQQATDLGSSTSKPDASGSTLANAGGATSGGGYLGDLSQRISQELGMKVVVKSGRKKNSGSLTLEFYSLDEFDGLMQRLGVDLSD